MVNRSKQKQLETHYLERFKTIYKDFPSEVIIPGESPDFMLNPRTAI
jgi:hypothetical protein